MIISIRYIAGQWHWELYSINASLETGGGSHVGGKYAQGSALTWANMIHNLELCVTELEKKYELSE